MHQCCQLSLFIVKYILFYDSHNELPKTYTYYYYPGIYPNLIYVYYFNWTK